MLIPEIQISQTSGSSFFIKDITPDYSASNPNGYGVPNYPLSSTDKIKAELTYPNGGVVVFEALYKRGDPDWVVRYEDLQNIASQYVEGCSNCGSHQESAGIFPSGCYKIKYKVMGYGTRVVEKSNYFLSITGNHSTDSVWGKSNGTWVNITVAGTWVGDNFQWSSSNTFTEYTEYELRNGSTVKDYGTFTRNGLGIFNTFIGTEFVVLGETSKNFILIFNEVKSFHELVFKVLDFDNSGCYDFFKNPCGRGQEMAELMLIKSKLDLIDGETDCVYVNDLLKRINVLLKSINNG